MTEGTKAAVGAEASQQALLVVVKGLRNEPPLLFGIGAGIVLVGILAATTSLAIVIVVAAVFVAALGAWLFRATRQQVARTARTNVHTPRAKVAEEGNLGGIEVADAADTAGSYETNVEAEGATVGKRANLGGINIGGSNRRDGG
jgi:predicted aspartyl protease